MIELLATKGPIRDLRIVKGPEINFLDALRLICILELYQMERSVIEIGLFIQKSLIDYFVFVVKFLKEGLVEVN